MPCFTTTLCLSIDHKAKLFTSSNGTGVTDILKRTYKKNDLKKVFNRKLALYRSELFKETDRWTRFLGERDISDNDIQATVDSVADLK